MDTHTYSNFLLSSAVTTGKISDNGGVSVCVCVCVSVSVCVCVCGDASKKTPPV